MQNKYHNLSDDQLINHILDCEADLADVQADLKGSKEALFQRKQDEVSAALQKKDEPFGTVNVSIGNYKITFDQKKVVEWDQDRLKSVYEQIAADGADPLEYIKAKYEVSETKYKAWPSNIKEYFVDARTVKPGSCSIKIEEKA